MASGAGARDGLSDQRSTPLGLEPANPSKRFRRFFAWYSRRLFRRDFSTVSLAPGSSDVLARASAHDGPVLFLMNHSSWWDPLLGLILNEEFLPDRPGWVPMELEQLGKFAFMKRLGIFGIDPDHPDAMELLVKHALELIRDHPRSVFGITPQGAFADVRTPIRLRPGAAAIASGSSNMHALSIACEFTFWHERKPSVFVRAVACGSPPAPSTSSWHRLLTKAMRDNQEELANLVMARDGQNFERWLGRGDGGAHPVYDAMQRARGSASTITPSSRGDHR